MHLPKPKGEVNQLSSPAETATSPAVEAKVDATRDAMVAAIRTTLGAAVVDTLVKPGDDIWVRVTTESWCSSIQALKDAHAFDYFCFLSAIDWMPSPYGRGEDDPSEPAPVRDTVIRPGYTGGDTRMQMLVRLVNSVTHLGINIKADVPNDSFTIDSICTVFAGANWHEREAHEMFAHWVALEINRQIHFAQVWVTSKTNSKHFVCFALVPVCTSKNCAN